MPGVALVGAVTIRITWTVSLIEPLMPRSPVSGTPSPPVSAVTVSRLSSTPSPLLSTATVMKPVVVRAAVERKAPVLLACVGSR